MVEGRFLKLRLTFPSRLAEAMPPGADRRVVATVLLAAGPEHAARVGAFASAAVAAVTARLRGGGGLRT